MSKNNSENLPAIYARNTTTIERLKSKTTLEVGNYFVFYGDKMILLQGMVATISNQLSQKELNTKFDKYIPLFDLIANSLVINNVYANKQDTTKKLYSR